MWERGEGRGVRGESRWARGEGRGARGEGRGATGDGGGAGAQACPPGSFHLVREAACGAAEATYCTGSRGTRCGSRGTARWLL